MLSYFSKAMKNKASGVLLWYEEGTSLSIFSGRRGRAQLRFGGKG